MKLFVSSVVEDGESSTLRQYIQWNESATSSSLKRIRLLAHLSCVYTKPFFGAPKNSSEGY